MIRRKTPMWTLSQALELIRDLQPLVREEKYHMLLGGGVLNKGESDKDLDLVFIPLNGEESHPGKIVAMLFDVFGSFGKAIRDSPDYGSGSIWYFKEMIKYDYLGKRIDVFIQ